MSKASSKGGLMQSLPSLLRVGPSKLGLSLRRSSEGSPGKEPSESKAKAATKGSEKVVKKEDRNNNNNNEKGGKPGAKSVTIVSNGESGKAVRRTKAKVKAKEAERKKRVELEGPHQNGKVEGRRRQKERLEGEEGLESGPVTMVLNNREVQYPHKGTLTNGRAVVVSTIGHSGVDVRGRPIVRKKWRPLSYAEPGGVGGMRLSVYNPAGGGVEGVGGSVRGLGGSGRSRRGDVVFALAPGDNGGDDNSNNDNSLMENCGSGSSDYVRNLSDYYYYLEGSQVLYGHVGNLEARVRELRQQQLARRKSIDFAISCVEPDPTCLYSLEVEREADGGGTSNGGGLEGVGQERLGIYIKSVVPGGSADMDGRLSAGDQLLTVDGQSLVGITQEKAAEYLVRTGQIVTLEVAKQAAIYQGLATMLSQPSPVLTRGGQPRRMSERDLPSKVMREQGQEVLEAHHIPHGGVMQPRMQSSKSVPSLNSDADRPIPASASMGFPATAGGMNGHATMVPPGVRSPGSYAHQQQIQHPNYSHQQQLDPNLSPRYPPQQGQQGYHPGMSMTMQPQGAARQLQYNQQQQQYPGGGPEHVNHLRSKSIQSLADPPHRPDIGSKQPSTPALNMQAQESERFYQNVGYYPQQQQQQGQAGNIPLRTYIPYSNSVGNIPPNAGFANAGSMPAFRPGMQQQQQFRGPAGAPNPNMWRNSASQIQPGMNVAMQRDLMRQEAKMLEMQDELRRREERAALMMNKAAQQERQQQNRYNAQFTYTPGQQVGPQMLQQARERMNSGGGQAGFAPSVPTKPFRPDSMHDEGPGRPPLPDGYRYSTGDLPRGIGVLPYTNGVHGKQVQGTNPWERAEKEREAARRKEAARQWREQQIMELESLSNRNAPQEEQLRGLKLEREFQRRAEEMRRDDDGEGEEEEEEDDDRKNMVRRVQEDVERMRISGGAATAIANLPNGTKDPMNEERARKIEEMRRKKLELEAAQAAEERLVREATKRREEEFRRQQSQQHLQQQQAQMQAQQQQQHQSYQLQSRTQSYSSGVRSTESSGNAPSPGMLSPNNPVAPAPPLPKSPPPTLYRATAYGSNINNVGGHAPSPDRSPVTPPEVSPKARAERKTVSFNETVDTNEASEEEVNNGEKVREDPNRFFTEATAMLSSPRSPDGISGGIGINTPGVIGAQEVYRDPRTRRLAEQQQNKQAATPKPEKLSFKEKMKMFAMEAGEGESTPKEKPKVSKAQREIETTPGAAP